MKFADSRFFREGLTLISGNVWAQLIAFAAYLVLARLFSPEDMGLYTVFYSYIDVLIIFSTGRYELAVVLAKDESEAQTVSRLALRINMFFCLLLLAVVAAVVLAQGSGMLQRSKMGHIALLIPPMVFFCGTSRVYAALLNRVREFRHIALSEVVGSTAGLLAKVLMGLPCLAMTAWHTLGLSLGTVIGKAASNINYLIKMKQMGLQLVARHDFAAERSVACRYRNFPLFTMPKDFVNSFSYNLPFLWLAHYFDKAEVGLLGLALTFTFRPINILNSAFERLLYVRVAEKVQRRQSVAADLRRFVLWLNVAALPCFVVLFLYADVLFGLLFGGRWAGCGYYVRCLLPWVYIMLTSTSLMFISNIFSRQRTEFYFYIVLMLLRVVAVVVGIVSGNFRLAILLFALAGAVVSAVLLVWCARLVGNYEKERQRDNKTTSAPLSP